MKNFLTKLLKGKQTTQDDKSERAESFEIPESFHTRELIHFYKLDHLAWYSSPARTFSFRDFNEHEKILNYLDSTEIGMINTTTFYSSFTYPAVLPEHVICELKIYLDTPEDCDYHFKFAAESNEIFVKGDGGKNGIDYLVNSLKYVILNDADLRDKTIKFSDIVYLPQNRQQDLNNIEKNLIEEELFLKTMNNEIFLRRN